MSNFSIFSKCGEKRKRDGDDIDEPKNKLTKDQRYENTNRVRKFVPSWKLSYTWLEYSEKEDIMYCKICKKFPSISARPIKLKGQNTMVQGTNNFRLHAIKAHEVSLVHKECIVFEKKGISTTATEDVVNFPTTPIGVLVSKIDKSKLDRMARLFDIAYALAKHAKPLSDMKFHSRIAQKLEVDLGGNYQNDDAARLFISSISAVLRSKIQEKIMSSNFITLLADGSTDRSITEQETVFVRFVGPDGRLETMFTDIVELEHAHANGVFSALDKGLTKLGLSIDMVTSRHGLNHGKLPVLVGVNFDGANVMLGHKTGVVAKFKELAPYIIPIHCVAHKLELAILDAVKEIPYLTKFEEKIKSIFKFYHYSPKQRRELTQIANVLEEDLAHFSSVKQVRWLASKNRAIKAVHQNYKALCTHVEAAAASRSGTSSNKANNFAKEIKSFKFVKTLHIMMDVLPILKSLSEVFQKDKLLVTDIPTEIEGITLQLEALKMDPNMVGRNMAQFCKMYQPTTKTYSDVLLTGCPASFTYTEDSFLGQMIQGILTYIDKRFAVFHQPPLSHFKVFNFATWPTGRTELAGFGNKDVQSLTNHFSAVLDDDDQHAMMNQFQLLKARVRSFDVKNVLSTYSDLLESRPPSLCSVLKLVELMLVMSPSTAICERLFSSMNLVKTDRRTKLKADALQNLLTIKVHGPTIEEFKPLDSIHHWMNTCSGTRHTNGHIIP